MLLTAELAAKFVESLKGNGVGVDQGEITDILKNDDSIVVLSHFGIDCGDGYNYRHYKITDLGVETRFGVTDYKMDEPLTNKLLVFMYTELGEDYVKSAIDEQTKAYNKQRDVLKNQHEAKIAQLKALSQKKNPPQMQ